MSRLLLDNRDIDGAYVCPHFLNPCHERHLLNQLDGDRLCTPAEEMDGELRWPIICLNVGAGPAWTQIAWQDSEDDLREDDYV